MTTRRQGDGLGHRTECGRNTLDVDERRHRSVEENAGAIVNRQREVVLACCANVDVTHDCGRECGFDRIVQTRPTVLLLFVVSVLDIQRFQCTTHCRFHRVVPFLRIQVELVRLWNVARSQTRDVRFTLSYNSKQQLNTTLVLQSERPRYRAETVRSRDLIHAIHHLTTVNARDQPTRRVQCQPRIKRRGNAIGIENGVAQQVDGTNRQPHENRLTFETGRDVRWRTNHYA